MYGINKTQKIINDNYVTTYEKEVKAGGTNVIVEAGTNSGLAPSEDTFTFLSVFTGDDKAVPDIVVCKHDEQPIGVEFIFHGDEDLDAFVKTLLFALETVVDQVAEAKGE